MPRGSKAVTLSTAGSDIVDVAFDGTDCLVVGIYNGTLQEWSIALNRKVAIRSTGPSLICLDASLRHIFAAPGEDAALHELFIWRRSRHTEAPEEKASRTIMHPFPITAVCHIPGPYQFPLVATGAADKLIRFWDFETGDSLQIFGPPHPGYKEGIAFLQILNQHERTLVSGTEEGDLHVWSVPEQVGGSAEELKMEQAFSAQP